MRTRNALLALSTLLSARVALADHTTVPITTSSEEARAAYLKGRDLAEKLRATDAHAQFAIAVAKDPNLGVAYLGLSQTAGTTQEFFAAIDKAVASLDHASPGEQLEIRAAAAGAKADPVHQKEYLEKLAAQFPKDARVQNQLGAFYFGRLDYAGAIASYEKAIAIDPAFTQPYNQLGYAYRFVEKLPEAERTFKKYIDLLPGDPNPYDSYGELLMEEGKFDESIKSYEKALEIDPNFVASFIGIGNDQVFAGKSADARATFGRFLKAARNDGEKRTALFWTAESYIHDAEAGDKAAWDKALGELDKEAAIATAAGDQGNLANDYNFIATIDLEAGRLDEALAKFKLQVATSVKANIPDELKELTRHNGVFDEGWVAVQKHDVATATAKADAYAKIISANRPFEQRQLHELRGLIALEKKQWAAALTELGQSTPHDPRLFYLIALAHQGAGDAKNAKLFAHKAADFNGLAPNYAFVRAKAKALLAALK